MSENPIPSFRTTNSEIDCKAEAESILACITTDQTEEQEMRSLRIIQDRLTSFADRVASETREQLAQIFDAYAKEEPAAVISGQYVLIASIIRTHSLSTTNPEQL